MFVFLLFTLSCSTCCDKKYQQYDPCWGEEPVKVDLSQYSFLFPNTEFSHDGRYICVWESNIEGNICANSIPRKIVLFDTTGNVIFSKADFNGTVKEDFMLLFPKILWPMQYADFLKESVGWDIMDDGSTGFRIVENKKIDVLTVQFKGELWQLRPEKKILWSVELPPTVANSISTYFAGFFQKNEDKFIVISEGGENGYILSQNDGTIISRFTFGHIESDKELLNYKKKNNLQNVYRFHSYCISLERSNRLLACGSFDDKRVRVISLDSPFPMLFEANAGVDPNKPRGGRWYVMKVRFAGDNYLIIEYTFAGRGTSVVYEPTEIFDMRSWKIIWSENSRKISSVSISQDGGKIALVKDNVLEIGAPKK
jgi:hypothetical protein